MLWLDLEGAEVRDSEGALLGVVTHVYNTGASDIIEVRAPQEPSSPGGLRRIVDLPLVGDYVDLSQPLELGPPKVLRLKVPASIFADLWQEMD